MVKPYCKKCKKIFTRDWNFKRHLSDVHNVEDRSRSDIVNQSRENLTHEPYNSNSFGEQNVDDIYNKFQQNYDSQNNNLSTHPLQDEYYNIESFPGGFINSHIPVKGTFNIDEEIKIQKQLKNLENILLKILPRFLVVGRINMLMKECYYEQSNDPLKRYLVKKNMGHLWSDIIK
jgi:hypothetical protein